MSSSPDPLHGHSRGSPSSVSQVTPEPALKRRRVERSPSREHSHFDTDADQPNQLPPTTESRADGDEVSSHSSLTPTLPTIVDSATVSNHVAAVRSHATTPSKHTHLYPGTPDAQYESENTDMASSPLPGSSTTRSQAPSKLQYQPRLILRGHKRAVAMVRFSPDGRWIASCSADATAKIWASSSGQLAATLSGHLAGLSCLAWAPGSGLIATGSDDKSIRLWVAPSGKPYTSPLLGHNNYVYSVAFSPKGNMLVSGSYDEAVFLWDVRTGRVLRKLPAHSDPVGGVDFVSDGTLIASCSSDGLIRVWDTATGQCLRTFFHEDTPPAVGVQFSPNGRYILAWMLDSSLRMWNYVEGRCVKTYQGHKNVKYSLNGAFGTYGDEYGNDLSQEHSSNSGNMNGDESLSRNDRTRQRALVVSGSEDGAVLFWDVITKEILQRIPAHEEVVLGVDMHPTEKIMVSCSLDCTIRVWAEKRIPKPRLSPEEQMEDVHDFVDEPMVD